MNARVKWLDRKFNFDYPAGMFPYFLERLRDTPIVLSGISAPLEETVLTRRLKNTWSIKEHIGHLTDLEEIHITRLEQLIEGVSMLLPANMTNKKTYLANHNETDIAGLLGNLKKTRGNLISRFEKLTDADIIRKATHPRLQQEMRVVDLAYFVAEHDNHHITMIREILNDKE